MSIRNLKTVLHTGETSRLIEVTIQGTPVVSMGVVVGAQVQLMLRANSSPLLNNKAPQAHPEKLQQTVNAVEA